MCAETKKRAGEIAGSQLVWNIEQEKINGKQTILTIDEAKSYSFTEEEDEKTEKLEERMGIGTPDMVVNQLKRIKKNMKLMS